jgi:transposase
MSDAAAALFDPAPFVPQEQEVPTPEASDDAEARRLRTVDRRQFVISTKCLNDLLPPEHEARLIWQYVCTLNLRPLLARIQAVKGGCGRNATDPRILIALWLYATVEGIGSARQLARLCECHDAFRWIAGGVSLNHHTLSDFRVRHEAFLDDLLTRSVAALLHQGLVDLNRVTQDGVRVRASAGSKTFRRHPALTNCLSEARQQIQKLKDERQDPENDSDQSPSRREQSLEERERRLTQALEELERIEAHRRKGPQQKPARCSSTDPQARIMKLACGGFRPAYNVQFATDQGSGVVVGVDAVNVGSDKGQMGPMYDQIERRYGRVPREYLADGDFQSGEDIDRLSARGTDVYLPLLEWKGWNLAPGDPGPNDTPAMAEVRRRMASETGKQIYRTRASTSEWVNAQCRNRGLQQFVVRGLKKVRCIAYWHALAHNVLRMIGLGVLQPG